MPEILDRLTAAARPGAVFGEPVRQGDYTLITASEVTSAGGFGSASAFGHDSPPPHAEGTPHEGGEAGQDEAGRAGAGGGGGGGMGGGGGASARPVAVVVVGPDGVRVQPIIDFTKLAIVALTAWGAMLAARQGMRRARG
jgi:uncharacterized spore protein YtfJ